MPKLIDDASHWRQRAEEARTRAAELQVSEMREAMLRIAEDYDRLARLAEERTGRK
jgi:hypothetical protein